MSGKRSKRPSRVSWARPGMARKIRQKANHFLRKCMKGSCIRDGVRDGWEACMKKGNCTSGPVRMRVLNRIPGRAGSQIETDERGEGEQYRGCLVVRFVRRVADLVSSVAWGEGGEHGASAAEYG